MKQRVVAMTIKRSFFIIGLLVGCVGFSFASAQKESAQAAAIIQMARAAMTKHHLKAVILRVTIDGE